MTLRSACARAWSVGTRSAWKLEISSTHTSKGCAHHLGRRGAEVAADEDALAARLEHGAGERGGGALAVGAADERDGRRTNQREASSSSPITSRPLRSNASRAGKEGTPGETTAKSARREDRVRVPAEGERRAPLLQRDHGRGGALARRHVGGHDAGAAIEEQARRGHAAAPEPHHHRGLAARSIHHRTLSDASETSARRMEMIQKRTMILGSAQPFFS